MRPGWGVALIIVVLIGAVLLGTRISGCWLAGGYIADFWFNCLGVGVMWRTFGG